MYAIQTKNLTRAFGSFIAVDNISLQIKKGSIYGFLGPNGSGKSTVIRMLCGILEPSAGSGTILDYDIVTDAEKIKANIGYMSQKFSLYDDLTVLENLEFYAGMYSLTDDYKERRIEEMLQMAGLLERRDELAANLSGGWKQRLALGCSILHDPPVLFLDEPTGGVDPKSRRTFWEIIYNLSLHGTTIMVTTHFMDEAEHCDEIGFIFEGKLIASDTPENLKKHIPGMLLEIPAPDPMQLVETILAKQTEFLDIYAYGTNVHALILPEQIKHFNDMAYSEIEPSLEDVFVYYVKSQRKELKL